MISIRKEDYYRLFLYKLNDPHIKVKSYWSILKTLYNGKKIPLTPPLLVKNKLISNSKEKANHFNAIFVSRCTPTSNDSTLFFLTTAATNTSSSSTSFKDQDILKIINFFSINKAHRYNDISIKIIKDV